MIASRYRPSTVSNQSGVSYDAPEARTIRTTFSGPISPTKPRRSWATAHDSYRGFTSGTNPITQLDTPMLGVLGGVSGLRMLYGPNRASAKMYEKAS